MQPPERPEARASVAYQTAVLAVSALVIALATLVGIHVFQSSVGQPGGVALGLSAAGQALGAASPRGPAADTIPGVAGTTTATLSPTATPTRTPTLTPTLTPTTTPTLTPNVRIYDPTRAKTLLAEAQTSWGSETSAFLANVTVAAGRLNGKQIAPGATFSFNQEVGPFTVANGYQLNSQPGVITQTLTTVDGGFTQVSTTLFQAVFWAGLKIDARSTHTTWQDRFSAGSTGQRGLDAYVADNGSDLRFVNTTSDWVRIEALPQPGNLSVTLYGADPGWGVSPNVSAPNHVVQPNSTPSIVADPNLPAGQQFTVSAGLPGFDVVVQRTVTKDGQVVDRYGVAEHYVPIASIVAIGPTPRPTPSPSASPTVVAPNATPTAVAASGGPTHLAGLNPSSFVLPDGRIRVPNLVGLSEAEAQQVILAVGLSTTFVNYQGPGDVPAKALNAVPPGAVLSQTPLPGTARERGTTVYIAVRK